MFQRGQIYTWDAGYGEKPWLVVSNNARNSALQSAVAVRITSKPKAPLNSHVVLDNLPGIYGTVICDDFETLYEDDEPPVRYVSSLPPSVMEEVNHALRVALAL